MCPTANRMASDQHGNRPHVSQQVCPQALHGRRQLETTRLAELHDRPTFLSVSTRLKSRPEKFRMEEAGLLQRGRDAIAPRSGRRPSQDDRSLVEDPACRFQRVPRNRGGHILAASHPKRMTGQRNGFGSILADAKQPIMDLSSVIWRWEPGFSRFCLRASEDRTRRSFRPYRAPACHNHGYR